MTTIKVVLISGPKGSGKDTLARILNSQSNHLWVGWRRHIEKFAKPLMDAADAHGFGPDKSAHHPLDEDKLGPTRREWMIHLSENVVKPQFGKAIYGQMCARRILDRGGECRLGRNNIFFISDSGFRHEAAAVMWMLGDQNCLRIHINREGCSYDGDSRSDWEGFPNLRRIDVTNVEGREFDMVSAKVVEALEDLTGFRQ